MTKDPPKDPAKLNLGSEEVGFFAQFRALFFSPLRRNILLTAVCWVSVVGAFYGLNYSSGKITDNMHVNMALLGGVDVMSHFFSLPIIEKTGKKQAQMLGFGGACIALLCACFVPAGAASTPSCALV